MVNQKHVSLNCCYIVICLSDIENSFFGGSPFPLIFRTKKEADKERINANQRCCDSKHAVLKLNVEKKSDE